MKYALGMGRLLFVLLVAFAAWGANYRLFLKDGGYHTVREHHVMADRVRYYSVERGDWEEIPLDLVDLKKTVRILAERAEADAAEKKVIAEEAEAVRELRRIVRSIPPEPGVYREANGQITTLKVAESALVTDKKRTILKVITPVPIVAGKSTLEIFGLQSANVYSERRPEFYFRLSEVQQFALVSLTRNEKKKSRIVETIQVIPVSKELYEERKEIEIFRQQLGEGLYKVWPQADLPVGEYAWIEFTDGKANPQIWDFRIE